jgi:hypothetical protein
MVDGTYKWVVRPSRLQFTADLHSTVEDYVQYSSLGEVTPYDSLLEVPVDTLIPQTQFYMVCSGEEPQDQGLGIFLPSSFVVPGIQSKVQNFTQPL